MVKHAATNQEAVSFKVLVTINGYHLVKLWLANGTTTTEWTPV